MFSPVWPRLKPQSKKYIRAEGCYKKLRNSAQMRHNRDNWVTCIQKFQAVYQDNPTGPWAPAGLYMSGNLYWELYLQNYYEPDKKEALDTYERIIKRFPDSAYREKAKSAIIVINRYQRPAPKGKSDDNPKTAYNKAYRSYKNLKRNPKKQKYRSYWMDCIAGFDAVYQYDTQGAWAAAGLYMKAVLYEELAEHSYNPEDRRTALDIYRQITGKYPDSRYKQKAYDRGMALCSSVSGCDKRFFEEKDDIAKAIQAAEGYKDNEKREVTEPVLNGKAVINELRYWSNPSYTRIVVDASREVSYEPHLLKKDPSIKKPPRLYLDLDDSRLGKDIQKAIPINDNLLSGVRAGQYTADKVRVVIDIKSFDSYKIFHLQEPFRIVIDVWGAKERSSTVVARPTIPSKNGKIPTSALAKQLALGVSRVVIDAGHGGKDPGAVGYYKNVYEKDVTLKLARLLAKKIKNSLQCEVLMTRNKDEFITLEGRTAFANTQNADLFVSIHANAHHNKSVYGLETFFLNLATDDEAIRVAARENATSTKNISDLHSILSDLMQNAKINESSRLATYVQDSMVGNLKGHYQHIKNNGVKQAPFYVLLGAQMPAILIEASFISNPRECKRLTDSGYQQRLCDAIVKGIEKYIKETTPSKISNIKQKTGTTG